MGTLKQLLPFPDRPAIVCCLQSILDAGIDDVVVVVGPDSQELVRAIKGFPLTITMNLLPESDMSQSVRTGFQAISAASSGVFICPCDHPLVKPDTYSAIAGLHHRWPDTIIIPVFNGRRGHPTLFPRHILEDIAVKPSLRAVMDSHQRWVMVRPVTDEGVVLDMDTPEDYRRMLQKMPGFIQDKNDPVP